MTIWFITPAYKRFELSEICFAQRRDLCTNIGAECVVIANDDNLAIAQKYGFHTLERENFPVGKKFNDGFEFAAKNGATHVIPIGSDSWLHPAFFGAPLADDVVTTSHYQSIFSEDGKSRLDAFVEYPVLPGAGVGPHCIPVGFISNLGYRPADDNRDRSIDYSIITNLKKKNKFKYAYRDMFHCQYSSFKSDVNINSFSSIIKIGVRGASTLVDGAIFGGLYNRYPNYLVDKIAEFYNPPKVHLASCVECVECLTKKLDYQIRQVKLWEEVANRRQRELIKTRSEIDTMRFQMTNLRISVE